VPHYRVHILDASGKVIGAGQFDCERSETAQRRVKQLAGYLHTELGQLVSPPEPSIRDCSGTNLARLRTRRRLHS
jgi:hypothetical protein